MLWRNLFVFLFPSLQEGAPDWEGSSLKTNQYTLNFCSFLQTSPSSSIAAESLSQDPPYRSRD